jgi:MFS family permease
MIAVMPLYAIGSSLVNPSLSSLISRSTHADRQGGTMGITQGIGALGRVLGPPTGTAMFQWISPAAPYWFGSMLMFAATAVSLFQLRKYLTHLPASPSD